MQTLKGDISVNANCGRNYCYMRTKCSL